MTALGPFRRGLCPTHYERVRRLGTTDLPSPIVRLNRKLVRVPNGCLEWTGLIVGGYGHMSVNGKTTLTHRLAWELEHGPIPPGLNVLHHCDNPPCCDAVDTEHHLFLGTRADNNADMAVKGRHGQSIKTHCPKNHPYSGSNLYVTPQGWRGCRICHRAKDKAYRERVRAG